ncbi:MAG: hypothetical protein IJU56_05500, partial [Clostridia bacterium]|nr:hypothetical protein [Clostridia bacterium]
NCTSKTALHPEIRLFFVRTRHKNCARLTPAQFFNAVIHEKESISGQILPCGRSPFPKFFKIFLKNAFFSLLFMII